VATVFDGYGRLSWTNWALREQVMLSTSFVDDLNAVLST
jgi:hypothetical protein